MKGLPTYLCFIIVRIFFGSLDNDRKIKFDFIPKVVHFVRNKCNLH